MRKLPGREADDAAIFQRRYDEFAAENSRILKTYQERNLLIEVRFIVKFLSMLNGGQVDTNGETDISYRAIVNSLSNTNLAHLLVRMKEDIC